MFGLHGRRRRWQGVSGLQFLQARLGNAAVEQAVDKMTARAASWLKTSSTLYTDYLGCEYRDALHMIPIVGKKMVEAQQHYAALLEAAVAEGRLGVDEAAAMYDTVPAPARSIPMGGEFRRCGTSSMCTSGWPYDDDEYTEQIPWAETRRRALQDAADWPSDDVPSLVGPPAPDRPPERSGHGEIHRRSDLYGCWDVPDTLWTVTVDADSVLKRGLLASSWLFTEGRLVTGAGSTAMEDKETPHITGRFASVTTSKEVADALAAQMRARTKRPFTLYNAVQSSNWEVRRRTKGRFQGDVDKVAVLRLERCPGAMLQYNPAEPGMAEWRVYSPLSVRVTHVDGVPATGPASRCRIKD